MDVGNQVDRRLLHFLQGRQVSLRAGQLRLRRGQVGAQAEKIEVQAEGALLATDEATLGQVVDQRVGAVGKSEVQKLLDAHV